MRKKFHHANRIDLEIMWLHALGLEDNKKNAEVKENEGIRVPNSGVCNIKDTQRNKICKFPSGAKLFSWAKRTKEKSKLLSSSYFGWHFIILISLT